MNDPYPLASPQNREQEDRAKKTLAAQNRRPPPVGLFFETCVKKLENGKWIWFGNRYGLWHPYGKPFTIYAKLDREDDGSTKSGC